MESLKDFGVSDVGRLAFRLVTSIPPKDVKKLVAELRGADSKHPETLSDAAKVFNLPTVSNLSLDNSICVFLLINYFLECLKVGKYVETDEQQDLIGDLVFLLARAILVSYTNIHTIMILPKSKFVKWAVALV